MASEMARQKQLLIYVPRETIYDMALILKGFKKFCDT